MKEVFENKCIVTCTNNDKVAEAEVDNFRVNESMNIFMAGSWSFLTAAMGFRRSAAPCSSLAS